MKPESAAKPESIAAARRETPQIDAECKRVEPKKRVPVASVIAKNPAPTKSAKPITAPTVQPVCVKKPGEDCSCGDTGCDGPPEFVPSAESETVQFARRVS